MFFFLSHFLFMNLMKFDDLSGGGSLYLMSGLVPVLKKGCNVWCHLFRRGSSSLGASRGCIQSYVLCCLLNAWAVVIISGSISSSDSIAFGISPSLSGILFVCSCLFVIYIYGPIYFKICWAYYEYLLVMLLLYWPLRQLWL